jgi:hypothetical protein
MIVKERYITMNMNPFTLMQFMNFRNSFRGDPQMMVQQLMRSGQISQEQYQQAVQLANQFKDVLIPFMRG